MGGRVINNIYSHKAAPGAGPLRGFIGLWAHCSLVVLVYEHSAVLILLVAEEEEENDF